jgi:hypothetical protein
MSPSQPKKTRARKEGPPAGAAKSTTEEDERVEIDYEQLKTLTRVIQLNGIFLVDGGIHSHVDPRMVVGADGGPKGYVLNLGDARWWLDNIALDVVLGYRVTGTATREVGKIELFTVNARFLVSYSLSEGTVIPLDNKDNLMADLVAANGQINVFPYLRQFVNDVTVRAGWPSLVLSVFKAPARRPRALVRMAKAWDSPERKLLATSAA